MLLLAGLTLPAIALAALASAFTHFVMEAVVVCAAAIFLKSTFYSSPMPWQRVDTVRIAVTLGILTAGSVTVAWMQYFGRRVKVSRGVAVAAGVAAGALFATILPRTAFAVRSALAPIREEVSFWVDASPRRWAGGAPNNSGLAIPVTISGLRGSQFHLEGLGMRLTTPTGASYQAPARSSYQSFDKVAFFGYLSQQLSDTDRAWLFLRLDPSLLRELRDSDVEITGDAGITAYHLGETRWMPAMGAARTPLDGACTGIVVEDRWAADMLKLECESPAAIPFPTRVRLWDPQSGREWNQFLGDSAPYSTGPRSTWLSVLDRRQTFFRLTDHAEQPGSQWLVPRGILPSAKIGITPEIATGYRVVSYRLTGVRLGQYWVRQQR